MEKPGVPHPLNQVQVEQCMSTMQVGTQMVKLRGYKALVRFYYLDEHRSCIRWRPSRKNEKAKISIDSIQEVNEGQQSEVFHRHPEGSFDPNCCFSIYHGRHRESLDLVSPSGDEARIWVIGLRYLMAGIRDEDSLARRQRTREQWLKQTFDEADKNGDGSLSIGEVMHLLHKLNVNLPRSKVKQMFKEVDTDEKRGRLDFEEFCAFYKMMSTRRDLYLLLLTYSDHKDHLTAGDLQVFLEMEQKMTSVTLKDCKDIIQKFELCPENKIKGVLGIDGFTNYMRSPDGDIFNPKHHEVHQDMSKPLNHYFITSSHNTYLVGDQLTSQSRVDMYARVLQDGCRCVEVDCWDGPDGEPIVHHGYTLTSKILFKDVIETINKYAFKKNKYPVILSIENHCSIVQQKKMAHYMISILGDKLDLSEVNENDSTKLPSPQMLQGKILVKGKKLSASISEDAEEGEVSDEDSADEMDEDCKLLNGDVSANRKRVENMAKKKLDSLIKESKIRDCEDPNDFAVASLTPCGKPENKTDSKTQEQLNLGEEHRASRRSNQLFPGNLSKRKKKIDRLSKVVSMEDLEGDLDLLRIRGSSCRSASQKKTMKLSRALSDLVKYTKSVASQDVESEVVSSWQVSSFSETKAQQLLQQKPEQYLRFNQHQLSRIYPSSYRMDSSNFNPQPFWNVGCHMVALNYQTEGRMMQLNRAKFSTNGDCGYVLKPPCMCQGAFNPNSEDPLPGQLKKQLVLRIISGQQLPKPLDSMLGDRGEIIDPYVEVEIIGLPVDCRKKQTRVVDNNGFNPMWEETLVFTVHMPEITLVRFLVWDHDPIGRDFIGQRTLAFSSMLPGYRHVSLEGIDQASIFVHVAFSDISGKVKQALGLKGLFLHGPKPGSLDSHAAGRPPPWPSVSQQLLRRTASAPTKSQKPGRKTFPRLVLASQDTGSEEEAHDMPPPSPNPPPEALAQGECSGNSLQGKVPVERSPVQAQPPRAPEGPGPAGVAATCMKCVVGSCASEDTEGPRGELLPSPSPAGRQGAICQQPRASAGSLGALQTQGRSSGASKGTWARRQDLAGSGSVSSDSSSPGSPEGGAPRWPEGARKQPGALQRELNALFIQKLEEIRSKSSMFSTDSHPFSKQRSVSSLCSLETIAEEPAPGAGAPPQGAALYSPHQEGPQHSMGPSTKTMIPLGAALGASRPLQPGRGGRGDMELTPERRQRACKGGGTGGLGKGPRSQSVSRGHPQALSPAPTVRRAKSEGQGPLAKPVPAPFLDATGCDQLWQCLEPSSHWDSMSSCSTMSSSNTVIDLSLPGLGLDHGGLQKIPITRLPLWACPSTENSLDQSAVTKSKSNPNLRAIEPQAQAARQWGHIPPAGLQDYPMATKSKSLGDLTADDFGPPEGLRQGLESLGRVGLSGLGCQRNTLTEQLRWLIGHQQEEDITLPTSLGSVGDGMLGGPGFLRRPSSRSQSRVRAIAMRARQAQERQQRLRVAQVHPEERGIPEGACSVGQESCGDSPAQAAGLLLRL